MTDPVSSTTVPKAAGSFAEAKLEQMSLRPPEKVVSSPACRSPFIMLCCEVSHGTSSVPLHPDPLRKVSSHSSKSSASKHGTGGDADELALAEVPVTITGR